MRRGLVSVVLVLGCVIPAQAQELASSFDQLRVLIKAGDTLTITDSSGQETRGRMVKLTGTSLEIDADGIAQALQQDRITTIQLRHPDSLANGAKIGFGIGVGFGALGALVVASELGSNGAIVPIVLMYGAFGAGIGVGVDGLFSSDKVVFSRPSPRSARLALSPIAGPGRRGVRLTLGF